jgi:hypothetical protein
MMNILDWFKSKPKPAPKPHPESYAFYDYMERVIAGTKTSSQEREQGK